MSYNRVIPRDLFNEANLLKCHGQIYLNLERLNVQAELVDDGSLHNGSHFRVHQDDDGNLELLNVYLLAHGRRWHVRRPLNARRPFPLYLQPADDDDSDEIDVFNDDGSFTAEMLAFLKSPT